MEIFKRKPSITMNRGNCLVRADRKEDIIIMIYAGMKAMQELGFDMAPVLEALAKTCQSREKEEIHERSPES